MSADELAPHAMRPADYEQKVRAVLEAAVAWLATIDARAESWLACKENMGSHAAWVAFVDAEARERDGLLGAAAAIRDFVSPPERHPMTGLHLENERLRRKLINARAQITQMRLDAEHRNRQLDALHFVWCGGRCGRDSAVHRFCGKPDDITEGTVREAESNTQKLRAWWDARQKRALAEVPRG